MSNIVNQILKLKNKWMLQIEKNQHSSNLAAYNNTRDIIDIHKICHAPFKSMRFEQKGMVKVCCYNHKVILGTYPQKSIKAIWNSDEANLLRKKITNNDLSYGCNLCAQEIENKSYATVKAKEFDNLSNSLLQYPKILDFSLHNKCNLECVMCTGTFSSLIRKKREKLPPIENVYDNNFVEELEPFIKKAEKFIFAGGEPFLIDIYYKIWGKILKYNANAACYVVTNATILNKKQKEILKKGNFHITHSIDSFEKNNFNAIRKNASFEKVMENQKWLIQYCNDKKTSFSINVCPIQQNWKEIPSIISTCNDNNINVNLLTVVYPLHAALNNLNYSKLKEIDHYYSTFDFSKTKNNYQFIKLKNQVKLYVKQSEKKYSSRISSLRESEDKSVSIENLIEEVYLKLNLIKNKNEREEIISIISPKLNYAKSKLKDTPFKKSSLDEIKNVDVDVLMSSMVTPNNEELIQMLINYFA